MNLIEFVLARIAEDEANAHDASNYFPDDGPFVRWDSDRVLAECEAKRQIVETRERLWRRAEELIRVDRFDDAKTARQLCAGIEMVISLLALPYADHPDYAEAWRP